jgi:hypothetical protein
MDIHFSISLQRQTSSTTSAWMMEEEDICVLPTGGKDREVEDGEDNLASDLFLTSCSIYKPHGHEECRTI